MVEELTVLGSNSLNPAIRLPPMTPELLVFPHGPSNQYIDQVVIEDVDLLSASSWRTFRLDEKAKSLFFCRFCRIKGYLCARIHEAVRATPSCKAIVGVQPSSRFAFLLSNMLTATSNDLAGWY